MRVLGHASAHWRSDLGKLQGFGVCNRQFGMLIDFSLAGGDIYASGSFIVVPPLKSRFSRAPLIRVRAGLGDACRREWRRHSRIVTPPEIHRSPYKVSAIVSVVRVIIFCAYESPNRLSRRG